MKGTAANLGILANMGLRGSLAGTALSKSYRQMANPKVQEFMRLYNVETVDAAGNLRKMRDILADMAKVMNAMPNAQRIAFAEEVFDARGMLGGGVLVGNVGDIDKFLKMLDNAKGVAKKTAEEMETGIGGMIRIVLSALEGLAIETGSALTPWLMNLSKQFIDIVYGVTSFIRENQYLVSSFASVILWLAKGAAVFFAIGGAIRFGVGLFRLFSVVVKGAEVVIRSFAPAVSFLSQAFSGTAQHFQKAAQAVRVFNYASENMSSLGAARAVHAQTLAVQQFRNAMGGTVSGMSDFSVRLLMMNNAAAGRTVVSALTGHLNAFKASLAALPALLASGVGSLRGWFSSFASGGSVAQVFSSALHMLTSGLAAVPGLFSSAVAQLTVWKTALTAGAVAAKLQAAALGLLGIMAKGLTAVFAAVGKAMKLAFAHPVLLAITAVIAAVAALVYQIVKADIALKNLKKEAAEGATKNRMEADEKLNEGDTRRQKSGSFYDRLKQLAEASKTRKLTEKEIQEAERMAANLKPFGSSEWAKVDKQSGKVELAGDSETRMKDAVKRSAKRDIEADLKAAKREEKALKDQLDNITKGKGYKTTVFGFEWEDSAIDNERSRDAQSALDKLNAIWKRRRELEDRMKNFNAGSEAAITGKDEADQSTENADKYRQSIEERKKAEKDHADAVKDAARLEEEMARRRMNSLEQEIHDIKKRTEEYKKAIAIQLEYEKNKTVGKRDEKKIAELEAKLAQAEKDQKTDIQKAEADESEKFKKLQRKESDRLSDFEKERTNQREKKTTDRKIDEEFKKSKDEGIAYLEKVFQNSMSAAASAFSEYQNTVKAADADNKRTDEEKEDIDNKFSEYQRRINTADDYRRRLEDARAGTAGSLEKIDVAGSFFVNQVQTVKGAGSIGEKQLSVQEKIAKNTDETAREVKKMKTGLITTG
ncbi:MAG: Phage-related minor tail protein [Lentisphaerae bacterium ADurb.Bin242]|nr:MAG: Phage-related minor tail protein [Lentisphaerae bacterium ADurb.Bin242]